MGIELKNSFEERKNKITSIIKKHTEAINLEVSDTTLENLSIHLALNVARDLNGTFIPTSISQLKQLKKHELFPVSKDIIIEISDIYGNKVHRSEEFYTTMYLSKMNLFDIDFNCEFDIYDDLAEDVINETIDAIEDQLDIDLKSNELFYKGITLHFFPALERLQSDNQLTSNPLEKDIKLHHTKEYKCALILNDIVNKYYDKSFNDNELAYIALHFGTAFK